jgi:hypothetical protein
VDDLNKASDEDRARIHAARQRRRIQDERMATAGTIQSAAIANDTRFRVNGNPQPVQPFQAPKPREDTSDWITNPVHPLSPLNPVSMTVTPHVPHDSSYGSSSSCSSPSSSYDSGSSYSSSSDSSSSSSSSDSGSSGGGCD